MVQPLVYSCSGCSSAAQLANHVAVRLDREGVAEMSCVAGLGGDVPGILRKATDAVAAGRPIVAVDGCALACVRRTLGRHGITPTRHLELWRMGVLKRQHEDFAAADAADILARCRELVTRTSPAHRPRTAAPSHGRGDLRPSKGAQGQRGRNHE